MFTCSSSTNCQDVIPRLPLLSPDLNSSQTFAHTNHYIQWDKGGGGIIYPVSLLTANVKVKTFGNFVEGSQPQN